MHNIYTRVVKLNWQQTSIFVQQTHTASQMYGELKIDQFLAEIQVNLRRFFVVIVSEVWREVHSLEVRVQERGGVKRSPQLECLGYPGWLVGDLPFEQSWVRPGQTLGQRVSRWPL